MRKWYKVEHAAEWMRDNATDPAHRVIAERILPSLQKVDNGLPGTHGAWGFHIYKKGGKTPAGINPPLWRSIAQALNSNAAAIYSAASGVVMPDVDKGTNDREGSLLHELIHAATEFAAIRGQQLPDKFPDDARLVKDLAAIQRTIRNHPKIKAILADPTHKLHARLKRSGQWRDFITKPNEVLTYGLTEKWIQDLLKTLDLPIDAAATKSISVWTEFVTALQKFFGLKDDSFNALDQIVSIAERAFDRNATPVKIPAGVVAKTPDGVDGGAFDDEIDIGLNVTPDDPDAGVEEDADADLDADGTDTRAPRGSLTPRTERVAFTNRASVFENAFRAAGMTPDEGQLLPPVQQRNVLARLLENTFGFRVNTKVPGASISSIDAKDQMLDAYRNIQFMLHALGLPLKAISLDGSLTLALERFKGRYFGAYDRSTRTIHMPGRSNSFAHEWAHALDHFLADKVTQGQQSMLLSQIARNIGLDPSDNLQSAYVNLINRMFFDDTAVAFKIMELEAKANATIQKGPKAGQPTQAAQDAQDQIDRILAGNTRIKIKPSNFRENSQNYGGQGYWTSVQEMLARSFEAYVAYKVEAAGGTNEFITKGDQAYMGAADARLALTFPKAAERQAIFDAYDAIFEHIRNQSVLGSGTEAARPDDVDIVDPQHWNKLDLAQGEPGLLKSMADEAKAVRNVFRNLTGSTPGSLKKTLRESGARLRTNMGLGGDSATNQINDATRAVLDFRRRLLGSMRSFAKAMVKRNKGQGGEFLEVIWKRLATDIGTGADHEVQTYEEARERETNRAAGEIDSALKANGFTSLWGNALTEPQNDTIRDLMFGKPAGNTDPKMVAMAAALRRIMTKAYTRAKAAGLDIGFIEDKGYLPRVLNRTTVMADPAKFVEKASEVYGVVYDKATANIEPQDLLKLARYYSGRVDPMSDPKTGPYGAEIEALRAAIKAFNKATAAAEKDPSNTAKGQAAADAQDELDNAMEALTDIVRPDYMAVNADDWKGRVLIGDSVTYDSHGPHNDFMKERTLPPEADDILKDFYENDVLQLALSYVLNTSSRAAYAERFGNPAGVKKLDDVIRRKDVQDAINRDPSSYDTGTPAGRLNILKDLANPRTDNLVEIAMWEAQDAGARPDDVTAMRGLVENITGRNQTTGWADRVSGLITAITYISLLPKAVFTAMTEPVAVMMRTGDVKATGVTFMAYMGEAVRTAKTTAERAALARAIGITTTPLYDVVLMNRVTGDSGNLLSTDHVMARFFRANGLAQLTNAQRRAAMAGLSYWMQGMAEAITNPKTDAVKREVSRAEFRELGVPEAHINAFADWLTQRDGPPTLDDLNSDAGQLFMSAVARAVDQTIQNPRRADKAMHSTNPIGRLTYALTHFQLTFFRNVHIANVQRSKRNYKIAREQGASKAFAAQEAALPIARSLVLGFSMMILGQMAVSALREAIFNSEQWDEKGDDDERLQWIFGLALSRSGLFGGGDVLLNAMTGLRYERDLSNIATGAGISYAMSNIQNIIKGLPKAEVGPYSVGARNSENTNTAEHTALKSLYRLIGVPLSSWMLSAVNAGGPLGWGARYAALTYATSNSASAGFADTLVGAPPPKKDEGKKW